MTWRDVPLAKKQRFVYDAAQSYIVDDSSDSSDKEEEKEADKKLSDTNLFPKEEICNFKNVKYNQRTRDVIVTEACNDGALVGSCFNTCTRADRAPIQEFAPMECNKNGRRRPAFLKAVQDYEAAYAARDLEAARAARAVVEKTRHGVCQVCAERKSKLSPAVQACKDFIRTVRDEACRKQDGCCNSNCVERGMQVACVLQCDHMHTITHADPNLRKTHILSDYTWWSLKKNGGVEAMQRELDKGVDWKCRFCHMLEPTGSQAKKFTAANMNIAGAKRRGTEEERAKYDRQRFAITVFPKQQFVDEIKREERKCCKTCNRVVEPGQEHAFIFDHRDPTTKMIGEDTLAGKETGGVSGLVANRAKAATLDKIKHILLREIKLCDLLCANCDHRKTWGYPPRV